MTEPSVVDLVGVGLNATDTIYSLANYPERGSKVECTSATILPGGQTATTVIACQGWGLTTRYAGRLGDDEAAGLHRRVFADAGVDARITTVPGAASP
ncbi:MAG TPA: PfkB family carbohydrate kinase, partial [Terracidiphilus sp.]|nr:PfkB family carbohydrate kinase [Terracidiphilus sp.]